MTPQIHSEPRSACGVAPVVPVPVGHGRFRIDGGSALRLRLRQQRFVVLLRRLVRVGADDALARPVVVAVTPGRRLRRLRPDALPVPHRVELPRIVAAVIALVEPVRPILVEVLRREQIDRQRLDAGRRPEDRGRRAASTSAARGTRRGRAAATLRGWSGAACAKASVETGSTLVHAVKRSQDREREQSQEPLRSHVEPLIAGTC